MQIDIEIHGFNVIASKDLSRYLYTKDEIVEFRRQRGNRVKALITPIDVPLYVPIDSDKILTTLGAIIFLKKRNPLLEFKVVNTGAHNLFQPLDYSGIEKHINLRWYQKEAIEASKSQRLGSVSIVTGGGKTEIECSVAYAACKQHNVMFVAPTEVTFSNFSERLKKYNIPLEIFYYADIREAEIPNKGCVILTNPISVSNDFQKNELPGTLDTIGTLIYDEGHHTSCSTWTLLHDVLKSLQRVLSFSGTLYESTSTDSAYSFSQVDQEIARLICISGETIYSVDTNKIKEFIDAPVIINTYFEWTKYFSMLDSNDWRKVYDTLSVYSDRIFYICKLIKICDLLGRTTLTTITQREYGERILKSLNLESAVCWYGSGDIFSLDKKYSLDEIYSLINNGSIKHVIATNHLDEGTDISDLSTLILTEGRKYRRSIQRAGRVSRIGNKKSAVINLFDTNAGLLKSQARSRENDIKNYYNVKVFEAIDLPNLVNILKELENENPSNS